MLIPLCLFKLQILKPENSFHSNEGHLFLLQVDVSASVSFFFLSFLRSFLPTNFPSSSLPNHFHLPFSMPHPPHEPSGIRNPRGLLHIPFFPPI
jgi:hypothetical protein